MLASLATLNTSRTEMANTIRAPVATSASVGVLKRPRWANLGLIRLSRAMASGYLEAARMPAFPAAANPKRTGTTIRPRATGPGIQSKNASPAVAIGVRSPCRASGSMTATMRETPTT